MSTEILSLGFFVALIAIIAQTGAMFYWGGRLQQMVTDLKDTHEDHEFRLRDLEGR